MLDNRKVGVIFTLRGSQRRQNGRQKHGNRRVSGSSFPSSPCLFSGKPLSSATKWRNRDAPAGEEETEVLERDVCQGGRFLLCAICGHRITHTGERIRVNGSHQHTFANPHGFVFRIGCFLSAPGCLEEPSDETTEFTWFAGYAWRIEVCGGCFSHLGWGFRSEDHRFHGLVVDRLVEEPPGEAEEGL